MENRRSQVFLLAFAFAYTAGCAEKGPDADIDSFDDPAAGASAGDGDGGASTSPTGGGNGSGNGGTAGGDSFGGGGNGGNGGSAGNTGNVGATGGGGGGGAFAAVACTDPAPAKPEDLISNFEDGTVGVNQVEGRGGGFYIFNDKQNDTTAQPFEVKAINRCEDGASLFSFCTSGSGFMTWGAGFGTDLGLVDPDTMEKSTVDLSAYKGVSFWIARKGATPPTVKFMMPDANTAEEGGKCTNAGDASADEKCDPFVKNIPLSETWTPVTVLFSDLRQGGWGKKVAEPAADAVYGIQLQFGPGVAFDVCFDQLTLVR